MLSNSPIAMPPELTARELTVLRLLASGYSSKEIARELRLSPRTIEAQRTSAKAKFSARTIPHLIALAMAAGIIWPVQLVHSKDRV